MLFAPLLSAVPLGGPGFLLLASEGTDETKSKSVLMPGEHGVVLGACNPCVRVFFENSFPLEICNSYHVSLFLCSKSFVVPGQKGVSCASGIMGGK